MTKLTIMESQPFSIHPTDIKERKFFTFGGRETVYIRIDKVIYHFNGNYLSVHDNIINYDSTERYLNFTYLNLSEIKANQILP